MSPPPVIRPLAESDAPAIAALHARVFGPGRFARTAYRVREGTGPVTPFCRGVFAGRELVAALRLTEVAIGAEAGALLLGPLVVDAGFTGQGFGRRLIGEAIEAARSAGVRLIVLVGDEPYYGRFGFKPVPPGRIRLPGPVDPRRLLWRELKEGALDRARGAVTRAR